MAEKAGFEIEQSQTRKRPQTRLDTTNQLFAIFLQNPPSGKKRPKAARFGNPSDRNLAGNFDYLLVEILRKFNS